MYLWKSLQRTHCWVLDRGIEMVTTWTWTKIHTGHLLLSISLECYDEGSKKVVKKLFRVDWISFCILVCQVYIRYEQNSIFTVESFPTVIFVFVFVFVFVYLYLYLYLYIRCEPSLHRMDCAPLTLDAPPSHLIQILITKCV